MDGVQNWSKRRCIEMFSSIVLVAAGGGIGAMARFTVTLLYKRAGSIDFPWATFLVNVIGSALLGILLGSHMADKQMLLFGTGFCGAFTTFSTFNWETISLFQQNKRKALIIYLFSSYVTAILFGFAGFAIGAG